MNYHSPYSALTLGGGTFSLLGKTTGTSNQPMGTMVINNGGFDSTLNVDGNTGSGTTLNLGAITASTVGTSLNITTANGGAVTTTQPNTAGILSGRIVLNGSDFAANGVTPGTSPITTPTYLALNTSGGTTDTNNSNSNDSGTIGTGTTTTNSLKITDDPAGGVLQINNNKLTLTSGGLLFTGAYDYTIASSGGIGVIGANSDFVINDYGTGVLTFTAEISAGNNAGNSITKTGPGTVVLDTTYGNSFYNGRPILIRVY